MTELQSPTPEDSPSTFLYTELLEALAEQLFGIAGFVMKSDPGESSATEAFAEVHLLEGESVIVSLSMRGYSISEGSPLLHVYETIEGLLESLSPAYANAKIQTLLLKLEQLQ